MAVDCESDFEKNLFGVDVMTMNILDENGDDLSELFNNFPDPLLNLCPPAVGMDDNCSELFIGFPDALPSFSAVELHNNFETNFFTNSSLVNDDLWPEVSDGSDSGIDCIQTRTEPHSPLSLCSDASTDSSAFGLMLNGETVQDGLGQFSSTSDLIPGVWEPTAGLLEEDIQIKTESMDTIDAFNFGDSLHGTFDMLAFSNSSVVFSKPEPGAVSSPSVFCVSQNDLPVSTTVEVEHVARKPEPTGVKTILVLPKDTVGGSGATFVKNANGHFVSQVLKTQLKIQPKPTASLPVPGANAEAQWKGIVPRSSVAEIKGVKQESPPSISIHYGDVTSAQDDFDTKAVKRQQRMIKNRESACKSRKRKKEHLQKLEGELQECKLQNNQLKAENLCLKQKLAALKLENDRLKKSCMNYNLKATATVVLTMFLFFSVNWNFLQTSESIAQEFQASPDIRHGRSLLSVDINKTVDDEESSSQALSILENSQQPLSNAASLLFSNDKSQDQKSSWGNIHDILMRSLEEKGFKLGQAMCPTYFNSSESLRLVNELRGWVLGHEEELKREQEVKESELARKMRRKRYPVPRKLKAAMNGQVHRWSHTGNKYEVQIFTGKEWKYDSFLDAIDRRNDTFYVVSFRRDHLLLPATAHNKTTRPRMSLMMPAVGLNETMQPPVGSIAMMQIDCEVTATRLIHIDRSAVPQHLLSNTTVERKHGDRKAEKLWPGDEND